MIPRIKPPTRPGHDEAVGISKTLIPPRSQTIRIHQSIDNDNIPDNGETADASSIMVSAARRSAAQSSLRYCDSVLIGIPADSSEMGLTEDTADPVGAQYEFARWQLSKIFSGCAEHAKEILNAPDDAQQASAWIKLTDLINEERKAQKLAAQVNLTHLLQGTTKDRLYEADNWAIMRSSILEVMAQSFNKP
jgi:hypothetical protein